MSVVGISYYTDPACPWSWALEPGLLRLRYEFGDDLQFTYVMGGLAREFGAVEGVVAEQLEAGDRSGMPVDPRLWFEGPPKSSYPACIAVKAASEQSDPARYLRRLREGLMCRRRKLDTTEALVEEARAIPGLDVERFRIDLASHATLELFASDLDRARAVAPEHHARGSATVVLPSLEFHGVDGTAHGVYGYAEYEQLRAAALATGAEPFGPGRSKPLVEDVLRRFGSMATAEVAAVCGLPGPRAPAELWRLATEWRVTAERVGSGELWAPT
jgi:putative protein-disulfide isomerase